MSPPGGALEQVPDDLKIDMAVVMDDPVAHAGNLVERDAGKLGERFGRQARSRFPGNKDAPQDGILRLAVLEKPFARLPGYVAPNKAACLGGIDFTGRLKDRPAADRVLIPLDRPARQQINLASEDVFDLLVQFKEIPPEMHLGLEGD
jgi:hypothetical protein